MDFERIVVERLLQGLIPESVLEAVLTQLARERCVQALKDIRAVLDDDTLTDPDCFQRIEQIVERYEVLGPGGGSRHDFG